MATLNLVRLNARRSSIKSLQRCFVSIKSPPETIIRPVEYNEKILFGAGPSNCYPSVLEAMCKQPSGLVAPDMIPVMADISEGLKYLFQTTNKMTYVSTGTGMSSMESSFLNVLEPGDKVLALSNGLWGECAAGIVKKVGGTPVVLKHNPGEVFLPEQVEKALQENRPNALFVAHGESSTSLLQPIESLGELCHRYGCLLIVDAVASLGGMPFFMDEWEVDVAFTTTQKVISCPPGLAPISFSPRACEKIKNRKVEIPSYYFDFNLCTVHWGLLHEDLGFHRYHHTPAINALLGLREAISIIAREGLEECWKRHRDNAEILWRGIEDLGLEIYLKNPEHRMPTLTAIKVPDGLSDPYRMNVYVSKRLGIELGVGLHPLNGKVWRIGLMGYNSTRENVDKALTALEFGLKHIGHTPKIRSQSTSQINYP